MGEFGAILLAAGITLTGLAVTLYFGIRIVLRSFRNVKDVVEDEATRRRGINSTKLRTAESEIPMRSPMATGDLERAKAAPQSGPNEIQTATRGRFAAQMQEDAKKADDAFKKRILDHVNRPVPAISKEGEEAIANGRNTRLAIKHVFPPRLPQRSMSYLGGLPIVPPNFDWPTLHNNKGLLERLNFIAQIDCTELPLGPGRELLPDKGYLYFFAPMSFNFGTDTCHFVTRFVPGTATKKWETLDMPFTGLIERPKPLDANCLGAKGTRYDKVEIEFGWISEPTDDEVEARTHEGYAFEVVEKIRAERTDTFFGQPPNRDKLLSWHEAPKDVLWIPYEGFPANWKTARIVKAFIEAFFQEERKDVADRLKALGDVADDNAELQRLNSLQHELNIFRKKMSAPLFPMINARLKEYDAPPDDVKQNFLEFLDDLRVNGMPSSKERSYAHLTLPLVLNQWLAGAAIKGAEGGLCDINGTAHIGPEVVAALAQRHDPRDHQMFGEGVVVQVAAEEMKDRYILLLQLGRDETTDWTVGEMGPLQYWITPEDLAAERFENTVLTMEAY